MGQENEMSDITQVAQAAPAVNEIAFILPTVFTALIGVIAWGIKTKMADLFSKVEKIQETITNISVAASDHRGEIRLEISQSETKFLSVFATKQELERLEEKFENLAGR